MERSERPPRQVELGTLEVQGIRDGPLHAFMAHLLLYANGAHQRARLSDEVDFLGEVAGPLSARIIRRVPVLSEQRMAQFAALVDSAVRAM